MEPEYLKRLNIELFERLLKKTDISAATRRVVEGLLEEELAKDASAYPVCQPRDHEQRTTH